MIRLARYPQWCNSGNDILDITTSCLVGLKTRTVGGEPGLALWNQAIAEG